MIELALSQHNVDWHQLHHSFRCGTLVKKMPTHSTATNPITGLTVPVIRSRLAIATGDLVTSSNPDEWVLARFTPADIDNTSHICQQFTIVPQQ
jgi:hypothetical protein